jgi:murein DD-endopeptidase MepM/ murein hydrolase activator NlpD
MPRNDTRVFGAVRPGNRAVECRNGHCGVDLGGEIWGEHVRAVHDGLVEYVQRGQNAQHGGQFVRIAHRGGSVITQYFHLAAIPRRIERGVTVKSGDVVGLVGDTGVKDSPPHLHFSISIRPSPDRPEKYMDPEPLIALWPLRVPINGGEAGLVTTMAEPGMPIGSAPLLRGRGKKSKKGGSAGADVGEVADPAGDKAASEPAGPDAPGDE